MKKLIAHINSLSMEERRALESACGTTIGYLRKAVSINQKLGAETCVAIEKFFMGEVSRKDLRPHDYFDIWPEIDDRKKLRRRDDIVRAATE